MVIFFLGLLSINVKNQTLAANVFTQLNVDRPFVTFNAPEFLRVKPPELVSPEITSPNFYNAINNIMNSEDLGYSTP